MQHRDFQLLLQVCVDVKTAEGQPPLMHLNKCNSSKKILMKYWGKKTQYIVVCIVLQYITINHIVAPVTFSHNLSLSNK